MLAHQLAKYCKLRDAPLTSSTSGGWSEDGLTTLVLPHPELIAAILKLYLVHELANEVYATTAASKQVFGLHGISDAIRAESGPRISHGDYDGSGPIALQSTADLFRRIVVASMDDRIRQGFLHRQRDLESLFFRHF
jgi:hypothetical protein